MTATFFITFILINGVGGKSIAFLRLIGLAQFLLFTKLSKSKTARDRLWSEQYTNCGSSVSDHTMTILLGVAFACVNPIICLVCFMYFVVNTLIERYQNMYVFRRQYQGGGRLWQHVSGHICLTKAMMCVLCNSHAVTADMGSSQQHTANIRHALLLCCLCMQQSVASDCSCYSSVCCCRCLCTCSCPAAGFTSAPPPPIKLPQQSISLSVCSAFRWLARCTPAYTSCS